MNEYTYKDADGDTLRFAGFKNGDAIVQVIQGEQFMGVSIPATDVSTVAAELLKAAGREAIILPKMTAEVQEFADGSLRCGMTDTTSTASTVWAHARAAELLALAEHIEGKASREAEAEKKLQERRDALAAELDGGADYDEFHPTSPFRKAIDRIIQLEDGK